MLNTVLLIDDDNITLMLYEFLIKLDAFAQKTIKLHNGQEGIHFFQKLIEEESDTLEQAPELIFLDLDMPILNGWDFLQQYTAKYQASLPNTKIVILSSTIDPTDKEYASKFDVVIDFVTKPLENHKLHSLRSLPALAPYFQG